MPVTPLVPEPARSARWFDWVGERFSAHAVGDHRRLRFGGSRWIPLGRLVPVPTPPSDAHRPGRILFPILESAMSDRKTKASPARPRQLPCPATPAPPSARPDDLRRAARLAALERRQAEDRARIAALPVQHAHAAGIHAGDASHWVSVEATPAGSAPCQGSPPHTAGLGQLGGGLCLGAITTAARGPPGA